MDPYYKWLGIPPDEQPPHYYRLLGVRIFESDPEVIESAANQRMEYLQSLSGGDHPAAAQQLLSEMARARIKLLDEKTRATYNAELRALTKPIPTGVIGVGKMGSTQHFVVNTEDGIQGDINGGTNLRFRSSSTIQKSWVLRASILIGCLFISVCVLWGFIVFIGTKENATSNDQIQGTRNTTNERVIRQDGVSHVQRTYPPITPSEGTDIKQDGNSQGSLQEPINRQQDGGESGEDNNAFAIGGLRDDTSSEKDSWQFFEQNGDVTVLCNANPEEYRILLQGFDDALNIVLLGSFNDWNTTIDPMQKMESGWEIKKRLPDGHIEFKFMVDGKWYPDGGNYKVLLRRFTPPPSSPPNKDTSPLSEIDTTLTRDEAKDVLKHAGLYEGKLGVWYLRPKGSPEFISRQYGRVLKRSGVTRSLKLLGARLPNPAEMQNPPPLRR